MQPWGWLGQRLHPRTLRLPLRLRFRLRRWLALGQTDRLRRSRKPVLLAANKTESWRAEAQAAEFYELGLGDLFSVSALQGTGTGDLLDAIVEKLPPPVEESPETGEARIAIIGRPNVGKSSFLNRLAGEERSVVTDIPGTTRDTVDTVIDRGGRNIRLVDTAGIRRRGRIDEGIEKFALLRTVKALERADVAILVTDGTQGVTAQDVHIAGYGLEAYIGLVLAVNKWDLVPHSAENTSAVEALQRAPGAGRRRAGPPVVHPDPLRSRAAHRRPRPGWARGIPPPGGTSAATRPRR